MSGYQFNVQDVNELFRDMVNPELESVVKLCKVDETCLVTKERLLKPNIQKKDLADIVLGMTEALVFCRDLLKEALVKTDELKDKHISFQQQIIEQQEQLLKCKTEELNSVQTTVKTELRSYSDAIKKSSSNSDSVTITSEMVKRAVKCAVEEDDRSKNIMIFGVEEETEEELEKTIQGVFEHISEKPQVAECSRIGNAKEKTVRPIKVTLRSSDVAYRVLRKAGQLRSSDDYKTVFLAADLTVEERSARKTLVDQVKQRRKDDPSQYHYINQNNKICSRSIKHN